MDHWQQQKQQHDAKFAAGTRAHVTTSDPLTRYIVDWRLKEAFRRLTAAAKGRISFDSKVLVMCSGEGMEGTILCNMGYNNVTVSDISDVAVAGAIRRDKRLNGLTLNAECPDLPNGSFDVVVVHDGLHHLQNPVLGFTEMLRIGRVGILFLEPHDSLVGRSLGTKWERNGDAINYVFRWTRGSVESVASSYLGPDSFENLSFSFWHHSIVFDKIGRALGGGPMALYSIQSAKMVLDSLLGQFGNQFCGAVLKR